MKKISILAISPFPHYDILFKELEKNYKVEVFYLKVFMKEYPWEKTKNSKSSIQNIFKITYSFLKCDLAIVCGWNNIKSLYLLFILILFSKKTVFWSDTPIIKKQNFFIIYLKKYILNHVYSFVSGKKGIKLFADHYNISLNKFYDFPYPIKSINDKDIRKYNFNRNQLIIYNQDKIRLLISNRFIERKGYDIIIKVFQRLKQNNLLEKFQVTIIGIGDLFDKYKKEISDIDKNIKFLGWIEYEEYIQQIKSTDILLHASYFEQYGIPPLDAMAHGKLVIASDGVMSAVDRISNNINGFLFKKGNHQDLYNILSYILLNRKEIYIIGEAARNSSKKFTVTYNIGTIKKLIEK